MILPFKCFSSQNKGIFGMLITSIPWPGPHFVFTFVENISLTPSTFVSTITDTVTLLQS